MDVYNYYGHSVITLWKYWHDTAILIERVIKGILRDIDEGPPMTDREREILRRLRAAEDRAQKNELRQWEKDSFLWMSATHDTILRENAIQKKFQDLTDEEAKDEP